MNKLWRGILAAGAVLAALQPLVAAARDADTPWWQPDGVLAQAGGGEHVHSAAVGLIWDTGWLVQQSSGAFTSYIEAEVGQWRTSGPAEHRTSTQLGVAPMLRFHPRALGSGWFIEAGIGVNTISPLYRNGGKRFSTGFNFGDRLGVGLRFGERRAHEATLRVEHFSNAGIKHPNPGQDFMQLRYAWRF